MSNNPYLLKQSLLAASVSVALAGMAFSSTAYAAAAEEEELEEVLVTGSRIVRKDFDSNSPIVTVDAEDFETQTGLNVESYLNQLPEYNPASSPTTSQGDVQITPINSVGIASISLRGFGANRSLVLVNGKRPTPINALMVTDVNGVPSALIQRVETITGGASAVYGADAVAGVTNFILRDNFEGFEVDTQIGQTVEGDGDERRLSAVLGANFADGRGNVTLGVERYSRKAVFQEQHDFYKDYWANPYSGGTFGLQGINGYACNLNCPPNTTIDGLFANRPAGTNVFTPLAVNANNRAYNFNSDGTVWVAGSQGGLSKYTGPRDNGEYFTQVTLDGSIPPGDKSFNNLKWYNTKAFASAPQERYSFFASGNFDLSDTINVYARGTFAESKTETILFGTSVVGGWETTIPYNPATDSPVNPDLDYTNRDIAAAVRANPAAYPNPNFIGTGKAGARFPVPAELAILLNSRPTKNGVWQPN
ncbi:MAG: TonB-dependent receptor plug domain-containing protein, partial [Pseudomonadota bacterium]